MILVLVTVLLSFLEHRQVHWNRQYSIVTSIIICRFKGYSEFVVTVVM